MASTENRKSEGEGTGLELAEFANEWNGPVAASTHLYKGTLAGILASDTSTNFPGIVAFLGDGTVNILGFVEQECDNSSGAKGARVCRIRARTGTLVDKNAGGGSAITVADLYKPAYGYDDKTCSKLVADGPCIGMITGIDPESGNPVVFVSPLMAKQLTFLANTGITFTQTYSTTSATIAALTSSALTDNGGGATADGTIGVVTAPTALTDSTTGVASTTLAAITSPTAVTNNSGGSTSDTTLASITTGGGTYPDATPTKDAIAKLAVLGNANAAAVILLKNDAAQFAASQAQNRTAIVALTDAVKELSTMLNLVVADILAMKKNDNKIVDVLQAADLAG